MKIFSPHFALALPFLLAACAHFPDDCAGGDGGCSVAEHEARTPVTRADLDTAIHDYIMEHPKVLLEASQKYKVQQQAEQAESARKALVASHDELFNDPLDGFIGNPDGDVTIAEFFDNQCPWCKRLAPEIDALLKADPNVKIVLKEYVLARPHSAPMLGDGSLASAKAALAVKNQGPVIYAAFHRALMSDKTEEGKLTLPHIIELAKSSGVNVERMLAEMNAPELVKHIDQTQELASKVGVPATPGLVLGGEIVSAREINGLLSVVKRAREHKAGNDQAAASAPPHV